MPFPPVLLALMLLASCSYFRSGPQEALPEDLKAAVDSSSRTAENFERDRYQHPLETLHFFGITPQMTVIEVSPGAGYFTEILAPYLAQQGQYVIAVPRMPSRPSQLLLDNEKKLQDILMARPEVQAKTRFIPLEPVSKRNKIKLNYVDLVLTFNSVHNWVATNTVEENFKLFHDVLRHDGVLGIVQHRIAEEKKRFPKSGYLTESEVIAFAQKAGFRLEKKSEINANPKDTADYPNGVWTLPPFYRLGDKERRRYRAIGESDRMTLKFVK